MPSFDRHVANISKDELTVYKPMNLLVLPIASLAGDLREGFVITVIAQDDDSAVVVRRTGQLDRNTYLSDGAADLAVLARWPITAFKN
jgi:hypothetical protein